MSKPWHWVSIRLACGECRGWPRRRTARSRRSVRRVRPRRWPPCALHGFGVAVVEVDGEEEVPAGFGEQGVGLGQVEDERLLDQQRYAGAHEPQRRSKWSSFGRQTVTRSGCSAVSIASRSVYGVAPYRSARAAVSLGRAADDRHQLGVARGGRRCARAARPSRRRRPRRRGAVRTGHSPERLVELPTRGSEVVERPGVVDHVGGRRQPLLRGSPGRPPGWPSASSALIPRSVVIRSTWSSTGYASTTTTASKFPGCAGLGRAAGCRARPARPGRPPLPRLAASRARPAGG